VDEETLIPTSSTRFTFSDHLGAPFLQTTPVGVPTWRVEYAPYGEVGTTRTGTAAAQRLRFHATNRLLDTIRLDAAGNEVERHHLTLNDAGGTAAEEDQLCPTPPPACASSWVTRRSVSYAYDKHNRLKEVRHPVLAGAKASYDPDGLLAAVQDENHSTPNTRYDYDALDNLVSVTDPNGNGSHRVGVVHWSRTVSACANRSDEHLLPRFRGGAGDERGYTGSIWIGSFTGAVFRPGSSG
jgi:YD repeat-containing protein